VVWVRVLPYAREDRPTRCVRSLTIRPLVMTLDVVEDNWQISGLVWHVVSAWLNANPMNVDEFLRVFGLHHAAKRGDPSGRS
jgi:hypothetical protein